MFPACEFRERLAKVHPAGKQCHVLGGAHVRETAPTTLEKNTILLSFDAQSGPVCLRSKAEKLIA